VSSPANRIVPLISTSEFKTFFEELAPEFMFIGFVLFAGRSVRAA
jgi:hypothetical protein